MSDSATVKWLISRSPVQGGPSIYVLTVTLNGIAAHQTYFATRAAALEARDAMLRFYHV